VAEAKQPAFDPHAFLLNAGLGKRLVHLKAKQAFFLQGDVADSVFYLQKGRAKLPLKPSIWWESHL
jgi:CRP/FNR family cyclic AMP-dependent transcriptional regulator